MEKKRHLISAVVLVLFSLLAGGSLITGELYELCFWGIGIVLILIIGYTITSKRQDERQAKLDKANEATDNFKASVKIVGYGAEYSFAVDNERKKIMIATADNDRSLAQKKFINFADIISVELLEDSNVAFSKSAMRTIGGGLVGGAIAGGAGAIIGGLSGDSKVKKKVSKIEIRILVRNQSSPNYVIKCYNDQPIDVTSGLGKITYDGIMSTAKEIADHLSVIIDMMDREYQQQENMSIAKPETKSIADELEKLCALRDKGILSAEEFEKQKEKLLS